MARDDAEEGMRMNKIQTRAIQRALCLMELQLGRQRAMRERKAKKGEKRT